MAFAQHFLASGADSSRATAGTEAIAAAGRPAVGRSSRALPIDAGRAHQRNARREARASRPKASQPVLDFAQTPQGRRVEPAAPLSVAIPSTERQELLCSMIGLTVKLGVGLLAGVSLTHLASAYQQRLDSHSEVSAILELETARLRRAQSRFDKLFSTEGEERLMREQEQWIAPNRLRVVWEAPRQPAKLQSQL